MFILYYEKFTFFTIFEYTQCFIALTPAIQYGNNNKLHNAISWTLYHSTGIVSLLYAYYLNSAVTNADNGDYGLVCMQPYMYQYPNYYIVGDFSYFINIINKKK